MIIKGKSRTEPGALAAHLGNAEKNERVQLLETKSTIATDLRGALIEMDALPAGTRCEKPLYHAAISPEPPHRLTPEQRLEAVDALEAKMGLTGHARAVVLHEKLGREHLHVVWSRINIKTMKSVSDSRKYLNRAERQRVLVATESLDPCGTLFVLTLAWTGARVSEVLALTPASFQIESGVVAIKTLKRRRFSVRQVPIPGSLMAALDFHFMLRAAQLDPTVSRSPLWPWHRTTAWRAVKEVMRLAKVTGRPACPRGFRHGFGVGTLQSGVPLNLVQRWLGHAKIETTAIYAGACGPEEREIARRFWQGAKRSS